MGLDHVISRVQCGSHILFSSNIILVRYVLTNVLVGTVKNTRMASHPSRPNSNEAGSMKLSPSQYLARGILCLSLEYFLHASLFS